MLGFRCVVILLLTVAAQSAFGFVANPDPAVLSVGKNCEFADLQTAVGKISLARFKIHVVGTLAPQHPEVHNVGHTFEIDGGFSSCDQINSSGAQSTITGVTNHSVFLFDGLNHVTLRNVIITGGNQPSILSHGGGINWAGKGSLDLWDVTIDSNSAAYGGGINVSATDATTVTMHDDTWIFSNTALHDAGGINLEGPADLVMSGERSFIGNNTALGVDQNGNPDPVYGFGGGLQLFGSDAQAEISSSGLAATIVNNNAVVGGGISIRGGSVTITPDANGRSASISGNSATSVGGGVFVTGDGNDNGFFSAVGLHLDGNSATDGAAIFGNDSADRFTALITLEQNSHCVRGIECNTISNNTSITGGTLSGSIVNLGSNSQLSMSSVKMAQNQAGRLIFGDGFGLTLINGALVDNTVTQELLRMDDTFIPSMHPIAFTIDSITVANNSIGALHVLSLKAISRTTFNQSIVFQPGKLTLERRGGTFDGVGILTNDISTLGGFRKVLLAFDKDGVGAGFVDSVNPTISNRNYRLVASTLEVSKAIDVLGGSDPSETTDILGNTHEFFVLGTPAFGDLGAYERQTPLDVLDRIFKNDFQIPIPPPPGA
jgi:hypothetical protein